MNKINNILLINMALLLVYLFIINIAVSSGSDPYSGIGVMVVTMTVVFIHAGINLLISIISFITKDKPRGLHFLLSTFLVLVVGCAGCFVSGSI